MLGDEVNNIRDPANDKNANILSGILMWLSVTPL